MPDKRRHRGAHPDDAKLFAAGNLGAFRSRGHWIERQGAVIDTMGDAVWLVDARES